MKDEGVLTFRELKKTIDKCDKIMPEEFKDRRVMITKSRGDKWTEAKTARMALIKEGEKIVYAGFEILIDTNPR